METEIEFGIKSWNRILESKDGIKRLNGKFKLNLESKLESKVGIESWNQSWN